MEKLVTIVSRVPRGVKYDDDSVDRLSHRYTTLILVVFAVVTTMQQYVGRPITCWVPKEFTGSHTKFTNSYCWVKNTYFLPLEDEIPKHYEEDKRREILYYQWMPFVFLIQAVFFYAPSIVWHGLNSKAGVDADNILQAADNFQKVNKEEKREQTLRLITNQMDRFLGNPRLKVGDLSSRLMGFVSSLMCCICGKRFGNYLVILYIVVKILYVANVFAQLFLLNSLLKTAYNVFGIEMLNNALEEKAWINSTVFPKVTMCDFNVRRLGNVQRFTVQCLLPINLYTERMFIFLWFWMVMVLAVSSISLLVWILRAVCVDDRQKYIKQHLAATSRLPDDTSRALCIDFVDDYLKQDGVFLLRLIAHNTNAITVNEILASVWENWILNKPPTTDRPNGGVRAKPSAPLKPAHLRPGPPGYTTLPLDDVDAGPIYKPTTEETTQ